jgi:hypothetical protein
MGADSALLDCDPLLMACYASKSTSETTGKTIIIEKSNSIFEDKRVLR